MSHKIADLIELSQSGNPRAIIDGLKDLIPEYVPDEVAHPQKTTVRKQYILLHQ